MQITENPSVRGWAGRETGSGGVGTAYFDYARQETVAPNEEAQPTLGPWTGFEPVHLETPQTPKRAWFHCTTAAPNWLVCCIAWLVF
ncbi:hypothetical protein E2C01_040547 [Portunus trituberculatus]|uniref:Uncharacterized protein n=1 Tax=Portunus trituberculatus TaxID=210409 RepID=A0A5B7FPI0_PORTR|nr:hypothetical protein [Portunus trituberculatus]